MSKASDGAIRVDTRLDNSGFLRNVAQFNQAVNNLKNSANRAGQEMASGMDNYVRSMGRAGNATKGAVANQKTLEREIGKTEAAISKMEDKLELARRKWEAARDAAANEAARKFEQNQTSDPLPWETAEEAERAYFRGLNEAIDEATAKFGNFEESAPFTNMATEIAFLTEKLDDLKAQLAEAQQQAVDQPSTSGQTAESARQAADSTRQTAENVQQTQAAANAASGAFQAFGRVVGATASGFLRVASGAAKAAGAIARIAGGGALSFLRKLAEGARNAAIQLAKLSGRAISGGFKTLGKGIMTAGRWMLGLKDASQKTNGGFKRGLMTLLKYGLGIRSLYFLFRKLRQALTEGLTELARHDSRLNASINSMKASLNGLKGSLATAFAPIVTAVAPAITRLINMLTSAINAIGAFIAALTGQSTYQKAVAGLDAAGDAASGAGSAASSAADDYAELKRQLAGFDQLEILGSSTGSSGSGGGGGGGGGAGGGLSYETAEIAGGITDFVGKLKELWENADYEGIGRVIADGINSAFEKARAWISWDNLGDTITEAVDAITGIFNGLVDGIDWTLIGETFGEGVNTLVNTMNLLLTGFDWENLGKGFADGLNGLVDTVNWGNLGQMFANKLNALIGTIKGAAENFNWGDAGTAFGTAVSNLVLTIDWSKLGGTFATLINGTVDALKSAISAFDWGDAGKTFATLVNGITSKVKWAEIGGTFASLINSTVESLKSAITTFNWGEAGTAFGTLVSGITSKVKWAEIGGSFATLINGSADALKSAVAAFDWGDTGKTFANAVNKILTTVKWADLGGSFASLINGTVDTLKSAITTFSWGDAGTAFGTAVSGITSKVKWAEIGGSLAALLNGTVASLRSALAAFDWESAGTTFSDTINGIVSKVNWTDLGRLLSDSLKSALAWLVAALSQFNFGTTGQGFADVINGFFEDPELWAKAGTAVSEAIKGLFTWGTSFLSNLDVDQISDDIKAYLDNVDWAGIAQAIWDFLVAAFHAIGSLLWALLVDTEVPPEAAAAVEKELEQMLSRYHPEMVVTWGIDLDSENGQEQYDALINAFQNALAGKPFTVPAELNIPPESIAACYNEYVEEWNKLHPEAPIEPILPEDTDKLLETQWGEVDPELSTEIDLTEGNIDPDAQKILDAEDKAVTTKENLASGTVNADAKKTRDAADKAVTTKENLASGTVNADAKKTRDAADKAVTTKENLAKGKEDASALKSRDATDKTKTSTINVKQGSTFNDQAYKASQAVDRGPTTTVTVKQGETFDGQAYKATRATDIEPTTKVTVKQGTTFNDQAYKASQAKDRDVTTKVKIKKKSGSSDTVSTLIGWGSTVTKTVKVYVEKAGGTWDKIKKFLAGVGIKLAAGGIVTNAGSVRRFASGGVIRGGMARYLANVPHYASGTSRAHGTVFVAGEAGPEVMGHINGRTEILNKSQIAQAIYGAVVSGMGRAVNALGTYLSGQLATCTNAITATIGNLQFHQPVMASGSVLPYEVAAQIARTGEDIQATLDANNEDLIQTIISVAGQIVAAIGSQQRGAGNRNDGGMTAGQLIAEINRRTQMFGGSPLLG